MSQTHSADGTGAGSGASLSPSIVAIDGPAASGKTTVGRRLADELNYLFFDTGMMYRAVTWAALDRDIDVGDPDAVGALAESVALDIVPVDDGRTLGVDSAVLVDGYDATPYIRSGAVDEAVSTVSAQQRVRAAMSRHQRRVAQEYGAGSREKQGIVMVGRDIGTVVVPDAPIKVYLDARAEERARRRFSELQDGDGGATFESVLADINRRDERDSSRELAPLSIAEDATVIDTTDLSVAEVVDRILDAIRNIETTA